MADNVFPMQRGTAAPGAKTESPDLRVYTPDDFAAMYDMFAARMYRHAVSRVGERKAAEDIASQVFMKAWEYFDASGKPIENVRAFLYHIAQNLITDHYRKKGREAVSLESLPEHHHLLRTDRTAHKHLEEQETVAQIEKSLALLEDEYRDIVVWRYIDELSVTEIAALTGKTPNAVYVTVHRAIKKLRMLLEKKGL